MLALNYAQRDFAIHPDWSDSQGWVVLPFLPFILFLPLLNSNALVIYNRVGAGLNELLYPVFTVIMSLSIVVCWFVISSKESWLIVLSLSIFKA